MAEGPEAVWTAAQPYLAKAAADRKALRALERDEIGAINHRIEEARLQGRKLEIEAARGGRDVAPRKAEVERQVAEEQAQFRTR